MFKADNYNEYNYNQTSSKKHTRQKQYTIRGLNMRFRLEVLLQSRDQRSSYEVGIRGLVIKSGLEIWIKSEIWHQEVDEGR